MLAWIVIAFILLSPGFILTIPPVGRSASVFSNRGVSWKVMAVHAVLFWLVLRYVLPALEGFQAGAGRPSMPGVGGPPAPIALRNPNVVVDETQQAACVAAQAALTQNNCSCNAAKKRYIDMNCATASSTSLMCQMIIRQINTACPA